MKSKGIIAAALCAVVCLGAISGCKKAYETVKKDIMVDDKVVGAQIFENDKLIGAEYYDEDGAVVKTDDYDDDGNTVLEKQYVGEALKDSTEYTYFSGEMTAESKTMYDAEGNVNAVIYSEYSDSRVVLKRITNIENDEELGTTEISYTYNDDGSVLQSETANGKPPVQTLRNSDNSVLYKKEYRDDNSATKYCYESGALVKREEYNSDGDMTAYTEYSYGIDGNISRTDEYSADGTAKSYSIYRYSDGKLFRVFMYNASGTLKRYAAYDKDGSCSFFDAAGLPLE